MSYISKVLVFTGIILGLFGGIVAYDTNSTTLHAAALTGRIIDENGDGIANAAVNVNRKIFSSVKKSAVTDKDGNYKIDVLLTFGTWEYTVSSTGFKSESKTETAAFGSGDVVEDFTLKFAEFDKTNNTTSIDAAVAAFKEIGTLRKANPIDTDAITAAYQGDLQTLTQAVDTDQNLTLDNDILGAITDIINNNDAKLATQVIDKTVQRVFFLTVLRRIVDVKNDFNNSTTSALGLKWDEAYAAYQAIKGTADRENKVITEDRLGIKTGSNPNLEDQIAVAFIRGKEALDKKNAVEDKISIKIQRQVIRLSLVRAFYIGVLREVQGIISNRDSDVAGAQEKQTEGRVFYSIIEDRIIGGNPNGNEIIKTQFTGDVANVVADTIVSEMNKGFIGKAKGELEENKELFSDRGEAMEKAEEGLLYSNIFLEDLGIRLSTSKRNEMEDALKDLKDASNKSDASKANVARQAIETIIASYENTLVPFEFVKTNDTSSIDNAVAAFNTIGTLRKADPIDTDAITTAYQGDLQTLTKAVDTDQTLTLDSDILGAITDIKNNNEAKLATQVIDKTIQRVFFLTVLRRIVDVKNDFDNGTTPALNLKWDEAFAAFQAIKGTAGRDNKVLTADLLSIETGSDPDLESKIGVAFILGQKALEKKDVTEDKITIKIQRQIIRLSLVRAFYIGVLREVEGIISNRDSNVAEAQEKQTEGRVFYSIIEDRIVGNNPEGNDIIKAQLSGNVADVVAKTIVVEMSKGFIGKARGELDENEELFSDRGEAMEKAEEGILYSNIFLEDLGLRLGTSKRNEMEGALKDLKDASNKGDASKADVARQAIKTIITSYEDANALL